MDKSKLSKLNFKPIERTTLTADEIAKYLGLSRDTIYILARENKIPHVRIGRRILFKIESIDKWLEDIEDGGYE